MADRLYSVMFTGVGGQGILVASDILAIAAMYAGYDVKKSEVHGMAQRGGSVESGVRFGDKVFSPLIGMGEADFLVAFEKLEALRGLKYLRRGGICLINDYEWMPLSVLTGEFTYPHDVLDKVKKYADKAYLLPGLELAKRAGNPRTLNVVILGVLARFLPLPQEAWMYALSNRIKKNYIDVNKKAFELGNKFIL